MSDAEDAARYRWLRRNFTHLTVTTKLGVDDKLHVTKLGVFKSTYETNEESIDSAVDEAMKNTP